MYLALICVVKLNLGCLCPLGNREEYNNGSMYYLWEHTMAIGDIGNMLLIEICYEICYNLPYPVNTLYKLLATVRHWRHSHVRVDG